MRKRNKIVRVREQYRDSEIVTVNNERLYYQIIERAVYRFKKKNHSTPFNLLPSRCI